jgi:ketosteroid isomerase-like protein
VSQENVEVVRSIHTLWNSDASADHLIDPDVEYVNPSYAVESGVRRGRVTLAEIRKQLHEIYQGYRFEPERFVDAGEHVVVIGVVRGTSVSGVEAQWAQGVVWTVRDGKAMRLRWFNHPSEALKAVGLQE